MTAVWAVTLPDSEKLVLLALADCANDEGDCWPSMATLARKCSKSDRTVQASIKELVAKGHLTRNEVAGKGCKYIVHPRSDVTPEAASPPKRTTPTPEAASDKPSRTINSTSDDKSSSVEKPALKPEHIVERWNDLAKSGLVRPVRKLSKPRLTQMRTLIRENEISDIADAFDALARSNFIHGENPRGWKPTIDFLLRPSSFAKLIEGAYDGG